MCVCVLNILNHVLARKVAILHIFFRQQQPWTIMLTAMCTDMKTPAYEHWIPDPWEVVIGKYVAKIPSCSFSTELIQDCKQFLSLII